MPASTDDATAAPVFVITGQLAAGKSTLARAVLARFDLGYHIDVDGIREGVVSGLASPLEWSAETDRQFALALDASAALAAVYQRAGFAVAIEGGIDPAEVDAALDRAGIVDARIGTSCYPPLDVALERNRSRTHKGFDTSVLEPVMASIEADLRDEPPPPGWTTIDNGEESAAATAARILELAS